MLQCMGLHIYMNCNIMDMDHVMDNVWNCMDMDHDMDNVWNCIGYDL